MASSLFDKATHSSITAWFNKSGSDFKNGFEQKTEMKK